MLDLLRIPGTYRRPGEAGVSVRVPGRATPYNMPSIPALEARLAANGEAAMQFGDGSWSSSGHWKIVQGFHLSISVIHDDAIARARGEDVVTEHRHLVDVRDDAILVRTTAGVEETWVRTGPPAGHGPA